MKKPTLDTQIRKLLAEPLESPPDWLMAWAEELPRTHPRRVPRGLLQALSLAFDSWRMVPVGARSGPDRNRRLVYRAGTVDLDLEIEATGGSGSRSAVAGAGINGAAAAAPVRGGGQRAIRGQILDAGVPGGRTFTAGEVRLLRGRRTVARAPLNERGDFALPAVGSERYALHIDAPGFRCRVAALDL